MASKRPRGGSKPRSREGHAARSAESGGLASALAGITPPADELDAGFFHRTLARWLGLPEGQGEAAAPVLWSYDFWKAEIVELGAERGRVRYAAQVYRGADAAAERFEYWLELDARRRIRRSGWEGAAPDLTREADAFAAGPPPAPGALEALFSDAHGDDAPPARSDD